MSRMNEMLEIAGEIATARGDDRIPSSKLWMRCFERRIHRVDYRVALSQAIKRGRMREADDGQLLLLRS